MITYQNTLLQVIYEAMNLSGMEGDRIGKEEIKKYIYFLLQLFLLDLVFGPQYGFPVTAP